MTSTSRFVHLRARTEYSISQSTLRISELLDLAEEDGQGAVGIADVDSMFGAIRFYGAARERGIKPIISLDLRLKDGESKHAPRLLWIAQSHAGYVRLMGLLSRAQVEGADEGGPAVCMEWLEEDGSLDGIACLSGFAEGLVGLWADPDNTAAARHLARALADLMPGRFLVEIQRPGRVSDEALARAALACAEELDLPLCASHPMQFARQEDYLAHELRVCDKRGHILHDRHRPRSFTPHQRFMTISEMEALFADLPDALANAGAMALTCNLAIPLGKSVLPPFSVPEGQTLDQALAELAARGLHKRLEKSHPDAFRRTEAFPSYSQRLELELGVISSMGFDGYFMIVHDFIAWAKANGIPVGPGRGSGAGSLVAYSLGITDLDPLHYNLLFERFLNPERVSMPDFDIDFCKARREQVIEYVSRKYGARAVAGIANINTMAARAAIKAAGRALGMRVPFVNSVSSLVPAVPGQDVTLSSAMADEPALRSRAEQEPEVQRLLEMARALEGLPTAIGQHAAGLVISPTVISDYAPLYLPEGKSQAVTQYDKDDIEKAGLVKFDFLGLKTLTEIQLAVDHIRRLPGQENFDISEIPLDEPRVYEVFQRGDTHCVFQFESPGMQRLLKEANPTFFGDLIALNALYRPGPMDLIPEFIQRKLGQRAVSYMDARLEPILAETYGIMIYQEQVMQIAQVIGGYTLGGADLLRRAMGKKKEKEMAMHRGIFVDGASARGVAPDDAGSLFDLMEKFAGYGFNKSHAAAYTLLAYQTAYLKWRFPAAFYAAWLSVESEEDTALIPPLIKDARKHGVAVLPPDINLSSEQFIIDGESNALRYGLTGLKGMGNDNARAIVAERACNGPYANLLDLVQRAAGYANKKVLTALGNAGAFDGLHSNRAEVLDAIVPAMRQAKAITLDRKKTAAADSADPSAKPVRRTPPPPPMEWPSCPPQKLLQLLAGERDAFGFYFSKHPYEHFASLMDGLKACESLDSIDSRAIDWNTHLIAGVVSDCRLIDTKSGKLLIATIGDGEVEIEVKAFSSVANRVAEWFKKDAFALMAVQLREDRVRGGKSIQITDAKPESEAKVLLADAVHVLLGFDELIELYELVRMHPGPLPLYAWHPAGAHLARSQSPYAFVAQTQSCFDEINRRYQEHSNVSYRQGKPATLAK